MSIYVIRHSDKEAGDFYEHGYKFNNQPISINGIKKARRLVDYFNGIEIDTISVSEYRRTRETIRYVADEKGIPLIVNKYLNEIDIGITEKMSDEEVRAQYPDFWKDYIERKSDFRIPEGETSAEAEERVLTVFNSLDKSKNHILVFHEGLIRILICSILSIPPYKRHLFSIDFCSITIFQYSEMFNCWRIPKINMEV